MSSYNFSISKTIRKKIIVIVLMVIFIVLALATLVYRTTKQNYEEQVLVKILSHGGILSQMLAKDANQLYALIQAKQTNQLTEPIEIVDQKIYSIKKELSMRKNDFNLNLDKLHRGYTENQHIRVDFLKYNSVMDKDLKDIDKVWINIKKDIDVLLNNNAAESDVMKAVANINNRNEELLTYHVNIMKKIEKGGSQKITRNFTLTLNFILLSYGIIIISLYALHTYIIVPFDVLYKGVVKWGITSSHSTKVLPKKNDLKNIVSYINSIFKKIEKMIFLIERINKNLSFGQSLEFIFHNFSSFIPYNFIGVSLLKEDGETLEASYGISDGSVKGLPENLLGKKFNIKGTKLEKVIESAITRIIPDFEKFIAFFPKTEYYDVIYQAGIRSSITLPLMANNKKVGIIFFCSVNKNEYKQEHVQFLEMLGNSISISFERHVFVDNLVYSSILALAKLAETKDEDTGEHLERMQKYSKLIAHLLYKDSKYKEQITPEFIENIEHFSPMHDIGKVGIRDSVLQKPGKLTVEEFEEMKQHSLIGAKVLRAAEENMEKVGRGMFQLGIEIAEGHHEKWDGSGYPHGKRKQEIPLSARIVALADVFDALTSRRPYKKPFSFDIAFDMIQEASGKHFDPEIIRVFTQYKDTFYRVYKSFNLK